MDMAELQPEEVQQLNGGVPPPATTAVEAPTAAAAATATAVTAVSVGSKRQRRPSVRLGEIGGEQYHHVSYDSHGRRTKWRPSANRKDPNPTGKSSRTRTLTNLSSGLENVETLDDEREGNMDSMAIGGWRVKKRIGPSSAATATTTTKRVRSNWASRSHETRNNLDHGDEKFSGGEELEDAFRDFNREDSESPLKEQSPVNSPGNRNERDDFYNRRRYNGNNNSSRIRFSENRDFELSEPSDMDGGEWRNRGREGVRIWLEGLGLGRYWPVFEIHEVDDEVLPLLTLEDLKDMGISAVGSRRKMYCAIQKLGKEFS